VDPLLSWSSIVLNEYYAPQYVLHAVAGSMGRYDLARPCVYACTPQVARARPVDEMGRPAPSKSIEAEFAPVRAAYAAIPGASRALTFGPSGNRAAGIDAGSLVRAVTCAESVRNPSQATAGPLSCVI